MGEGHRAPEDRTDELLAELLELRARVRSLEEAERSRRSYSAWWKERFAAAMVGVVAAFAVLSAQGEDPLRTGGHGGEREQARVPATEPAPVASEPQPVAPVAPVASEPAPGSGASEPAPAPEGQEGGG